VCRSGIDGVGGGQQGGGDHVAEFSRRVDATGEDHEDWLDDGESDRLGVGVGQHMGADRDDERGEGRHEEAPRYRLHAVLEGLEEDRGDADVKDGLGDVE
jgi:hypothetical protein